MRLWNLVRRLYSAHPEDSWLLILTLSSALVFMSVDTTSDSGWGLEVCGMTSRIFILCPLFLLGMYIPWQDHLGITVAECVVPINARSLVLGKKKSDCPFMRNVWLL